MNVQLFKDYLCSIELALYVGSKSVDVLEGFTNGFYKTFKREIVPIFYNLF